ncbi:MAG: hypothetical protein NT124_01415, partial [Candidatus Dependentiae bacterium]|nr:hypothetical protein [Candidatus Dependentiae bacterium]
LAELGEAIRGYTDPLGGVQDPELRELMQKQIIKNRQERFAQERAAAAQEEKKDEEVKDDNVAQVIAQAVGDEQQHGDAPRKSVCNRFSCVLL